jgi:hypothetical protein
MWLTQNVVWFLSRWLNHAGPPPSAWIAVECIRKKPCIRVHARSNNNVCVCVCLPVLVCWRHTFLGETWLVWFVRTLRWTDIVPEEGFLGFWVSSGQRAKLEQRVCWWCKYLRDLRKTYRMVTISVCTEYTQYCLHVLIFLHVSAAYADHNQV